MAIIKNVLLFPENNHRRFFKKSKKSNNYICILCDTKFSASDKEKEKINDISKWHFNAYHNTGKETK